MKKIICLAVFSLLHSLGYSQSQAPPNIMEPQQVVGHQGGWEVDPKNGFLDFKINIGTIPGPIPVPLTIKYKATPHALSSFSSSVMLSHVADDPIYASIDFGKPGDDGLTAKLENGNRIVFNPPYSEPVYSGIPGGTLNLPGQFGMGPFVRYTRVYGMTGDISAPVISTDGNYLQYVFTQSARLGRWTAFLQKPDGFGIRWNFGNDEIYDNFIVIMDHELARVFTVVPGYGTMPLLWVDRFGHYVKFKWQRTAVSGGSVNSVLISNDLGKGSVAQWLEPSRPSGYLEYPPEMDLMRIDWVGVQAPACAIKGYPSVSARLPPELTTLLQQQVVNPSSSDEVSDGPRCDSGAEPHFTGRPTSIRLGNPSGIPLPSWPLNVAVPAYPSESVWAADAIFGFSYTDSRNCMIKSFTDPRGLVTTFSYGTGYLFAPPPWEAATQNLFLGVTSAVTTDTTTGVTLTQGWSRTLPTSTGTSLDWKCKYTRTFSDGDRKNEPTVEYTYAPFNPNVAYDPNTNYLYGSPVKERILDAYGTVLSTKTNTYQGCGVSYGGLTFPSYPEASTITVERDGEPTRVLTRTLDSQRGLPTQETLTVGGAQIQTTVYTLETQWALLIKGRLSQVDKTFQGQVGQVAGVSSEGIQYDPTTWYPSAKFVQSGSLQKGTSYGYDPASGRLSSSTPYAPQFSGGNSSQSYSYGPDGLPSQRVVTFDSTGGSGQLVQSWPQRTTLGLPIQAVDEKGITTTMAYDTWGRLVSVNTPGTPSVTTSYSPDERLTTTRRSDGTTLVVNRDGFGRVLSRDRFDGVHESIGYDSTGRQTFIQESADGLSKSTTTVLDVLGRLQSQSSTDGISSSSTFTSVGTLRRCSTTVTNRSGQSYTFVTDMDPFGRSVHATNPLGNATDNQYDPLGNLVVATTTDARSGTPQNRQFNYNGIGILQSKQEPETGTTLFSQFNKMGQPQTIQEAAGADGYPRIRNLVIDGLGRITSLVSGDDQASWTYSGPWLQSSSRSGPAGTVNQTFSYGNPGGGLSYETSWQGGLSTSITYDSDSDGHLTSIKYPSGRVVGYDYQNGRPWHVKLNGSIVATASYDGWGHLNGLVYASGARDAWVYNAVDAKLGSWTMTPAGGGAEQRTYSYDANLNLSSISPDWTNLQHDYKGELLQSTGYGHTETFVHDGFQNNTSAVSSPAWNAPYALNSFTLTNPLADNRIPALARNGGQTGWAMSPRGETAQMGRCMAPTSSQMLGMTWDGLGKLASVIDGQTGATEIYQYSAAGLRVARTDSRDSSQNRSYVYSFEGQLLSEVPPGQTAGVMSLTKTLAGVSKTTKAFMPPPDPGSGLGMGITSPSDGATLVSGSFVNFSGAITGLDPNDFEALSQFNDAYSFVWSFGDGTTLRSYPSGGHSIEIASTHIYAQPGTYTVVFQAQPRLDGGEVLTASITVYVSQGSSGGASVRDVIYVNSLAIAEVDGTGVHELHNDHLGTPRLFTNQATGAVEGCQSFAPYGETITQDAYTNGYRPLTGFTGHIQTEPNGLIYMKGRFYSPAWHRFLNSDQGADEQQSHQFAYAGGSPLQMVDPKGMWEAPAGTTDTDGISDTGKRQSAQTSAGSMMGPGGWPRGGWFVQNQVDHGATQEDATKTVAVAAGVGGVSGVAVGVAAEGTLFAAGARGLAALGSWFGSQADKVSNWVQSFGSSSTPNSTIHGLERLNQRGISLGEAQNVISNGTKYIDNLHPGTTANVLQRADGKFVYISVNGSREVVTGMVRSTFNVATKLQDGTLRWVKPE
jgi:RHS repeat-associated protein